jgi:transcriptional regulator GlxA family with amidase domain
VFVCGGTGVRSATDEATRRLLRLCASRGQALGALCTGSFALASAGVLDGYRCAIHWENLAAIREEFPKVSFAQEVFIIDRDRCTCSGGTAPLDLMRHPIRAEHGAKLAREISEQFVIERQRAASDRQRMPMPECVGPGYQHLSEAVEIMSANIEEPLPLQEIADAIHISLRQLERLFHRYLTAKPAQYYMNLRLRCARELDAEQRADHADHHRLRLPVVVALLQGLSRAVRPSAECGAAAHGGIAARRLGVS